MRKQIFTAVLIACLPSAAWAAGGPAAPPKDAAAAAPPKDRATWNETRAAELMGKHVVSPDGRSLGKIEDLIVDMKGGHVPHVVLSFGGFADIGDKLFVFPVNALARDEYRDRVVMRVERRQLDESKGFDRSNWPFQPPLERASRLRGKNVKDANGRPAGEIEDLVVDLRTGKVRSVIFAQNGRKGDEPKQVLPLAMFSMVERGGEVTLNRR